jgi:hypothetical protein
VPEKKTGLLIAVAWILLVWILFVANQQKGFVEEWHTPADAGAMLAVVAVLMVSTALGTRIIGAGVGVVAAVPACALGLSIVTLGGMGLAALGVLKPYVIWIMLASLAAVSYKQIISLTRQLVSAALPTLTVLEAALTVVMLFALTVCLINCLAPLTANDALVYHLNLPRIYSSAGRLIRLPYNAYANMPHNGEMLYTLFYSIAGETGAKLAYFFTVIAAAAAVFTLARRFVDRTPALFASGIFLIQPLVLDHRIICNVDVLLAYLYLSAAVVAFDMWQGGRDKRRLAALAVLAGFAMGIKYTAIAPCVTLLVILLAGVPKRPGLKTVVAGIIIAAAVFSPWLVKNEAFVGNPVYPLLETRFDGQNWDEAQATALMSWQRGMGMGRGITDYLLLPVNIIMKGKPGLNYTRFDGTMTPVLLMLVPLALLGRRRSTSVLFAMAAIGFGFWAVTSQQLRFLIPVIALLAVLGGVGLSNLAARVSMRALTVVLALVVLAEISTLFVSDQYRKPFLASSFGDRLPVVTGLETRQAYLERSVQSYSMYEYINRTLPEDERVFLLWENRAYFLERPYLADSFFEASTLMRMAAKCASAEILKQRIRGQGYRYVVVNHLLGEVFSRLYPADDVAIVSDLVANHLTPVKTLNRLTLYTIN